MATIRKSKKNDSQAIADMANEFADLLDAMQAASSKRPTREDFLTFGFGRKKTFDGLIAESADGTPIGYLLFSYGFESQFARRYVMLDDLFVRSIHRNLGVGKALMDRLASIAKKDGCAEIRISVWLKNPRSVDFYRKLGCVDYESTGEKYLLLEL
jgi:GNAT superfamily N-acetyltransferase